MVSCSYAEEAKTGTLRLISTNQIFIAEADQLILTPIYTPKDGQNALLEFSYAPQKKDEFEKLLKENLNQKMGVLLNDRLYGTPSIDLDTVNITTAITLVADKLPQDLHENIHNLNKIIHFIVAEEYVLPIEGQPFKLNQEVFLSTLPPAIKNKLCEAADIFLFKDDQYIAKADHCSPSDIIFHRPSK